MGSSTFGKEFSVTFFGESHGSGVAAVVDGCPAGLPITVADIQSEVDRRIPPDPSVTSARREKDEVQIISGVFEGYTTGTPIAMVTWNRDVRSQDYERLRFVARPGHADYPSHVKYGGFNDFRGGGMASGRLTVPIVMAGAVAKKLLRQIGVEVFAHALQIYNVKLEKAIPHEMIKQNTYLNPVRCADSETAERMREAILKVRSEGDSVGGIVECIVEGAPAGVGDPFFDSLDSDIAKICFSIPAVKGFEIGLGFKSSSLRGSENNDAYAMRDGRIIALTNNAGGILGGLTNGMPIIVHVGFKPTSSIPKEQHTVNIGVMEDTVVQVTGRHDPCIVPKAVPVVEAAVSIAMADHCLRSRAIPRVLGKKKTGDVKVGSPLPQQH